MGRYVKLRCFFGSVWPHSNVRGIRCFEHFFKLFKTLLRLCEHERTLWFCKSSKNDPRDQSFHAVPDCPCMPSSAPEAPSARFRRAACGLPTRDAIPRRFERGSVPVLKMGFRSHSPPPRFSVYFGDLNMKFPFYYQKGRIAPPDVFNPGPCSHLGRAGRWKNN